MRLPAVEEVGDAVTAHDQSRVYPAISGSCSDRTVFAAHKPSSDLTFWTGLSGGISGKPHCHSSARTKDDGLENRCLCRRARKSCDAEFADMYGKTLVAGVGFEPT
jgi:hypothetical protein